MILYYITIPYYMIPTSLNHTVANCIYYLTGQFRLALGKLWGSWG